jgi:hypothetical protein
VRLYEQTELKADSLGAGNPYLDDSSPGVVLCCVMTTLDRCPVCVTAFLPQPTQSIDGIFDVECSTCGKYRIEEKFAHNLPHIMDSDQRRALTCHIRQANGEFLPLVDAESWPSMISAHQGTTIRHRLDKLFTYVAVRSRSLGEAIRIKYENDWPLFDCQSPEECLKMIQHLQSTKDFVGDNVAVCILSVQGWESFQGSSRLRAEKGRVFIAMWFDVSMVDAYENGMRIAIEQDCKMRAVRVDKVEHNDKICDRLMAEIRLAEIVVIDCTGSRPSVFFEAGYAKGLGREVIWTCQSDQFAKLKEHFDTRQFNHIEWQTASDLRTKLRDRIIGTVLLSDSAR